MGDTQHPRRVHRLLPAMGNFRTLLFDSSLRRLLRWQRLGRPEDLPREIAAQWNGDPRLRTTEFPSGYTGAPVLGRRIADVLHDELTAAGRLVPVRIDGADPGEFFLYAVEAVVDCLDHRRSSKPRKATGRIKQAVFRDEALPYELPAFRVPDSPGNVYWNGWAADRLAELVGDDLEVRLVWSTDPDAPVHRDPMSI